MNARPLISIVTPVFNRLQYLKETIASVQAQTFRNWEMLIVDDGSSEEIGETVRKEMINDPRLQFFKRESRKKGACVCRNEGFKKASGDYVLFLDSDDLLAPECLNRRLEIMKKSNEIDFAVFYTEVFFKKPGDSRILWNVFNSEDDLDRFSAFDLVWGPVSVLWKKSFFNSIGLWNENLPNYQDFEIHIRALTYPVKYAKFTERDSFYRVGASGSIGINSKSAPNDLQLISRKKLLKAAAGQIRLKNCMTEKRKRSLAGLTAHFCEELMVRGQYSEALNLWFLGARLRLYGLGLLIKGWKTIHKNKKNKKVLLIQKVSDSTVLWGQKTFYICYADVQNYWESSLKGIL